MAAALPDEHGEGRGRWRYGARLGEGGLSVVYRALDVTGPLGEVALKVLRGGFRPDHAYEMHREAQWSLQRLHNEADPRYDAGAAGLFARYLEDHSGFQGPAPMGRGAFEAARRRFEAPGFAWDAALPRPGGSPYVVLELLPGEPLHVALRRTWTGGGPARGGRKGPPMLTQADHARVVAQLARACEYLAAHGLVHRDLRACNVQLVRRAPSCRLKVLDLGVCIAAEGALRTSTNPAVRVFDGRRAAAGYRWLPPEVSGACAAGIAPNFEWPAHSFDAYSLGVLWLELLVGRAAAGRLLAELAEGAPWSRAQERLGPGPGTAGLEVLVFC